MPRNSLIEPSDPSPPVASDADRLEVLRALADRFVAAVARLSLAAQEQVEQRIAQRRAAVAVGGASARARAVVVMLATERERVRSTVVPAIRRVRAGVLARVLAQDEFRILARATVTVGGVAAVAVLVLGVGRASGSAPITDGPTSDAAAAPTVVERPAPTVTLPSPATAPGPSPSPATTRAPAPAEAPQRIAPPVALRVAAIGADAPVVVVGLEPDGAMEIPADVRTVGWYEPFAGAGVVPGEPGTAVIAGHVDSRTQGRGVFWPLRDLVPGDVVIVEHSDGTATRWEVESVVRHPKTDLPIDDIFTFEGDERLALITCGGEFDRSAGAYLDNYVVTAVPLRTLADGPAQALTAAP